MFQVRVAAGRALAARLLEYKGRRDLIVLGLPRGGVPVAFEVAAALYAPLDVLLVRKLGVPGHAELAMGALASGGALYVDHSLMREEGVTQDAFDRILAVARSELERRETLYRATRAPLEVADRIAIVADDGMATGATLYAAVQALRARRPAKIVAALPVAPYDARDRVGHVVDEFVCALTPSLFFSVGQFYLDFSETSDDEVRNLLERARAMPPAPSQG